MLFYNFIIFLIIAFLAFASSSNVDNAIDSLGYKLMNCLKFKGSKSKLIISRKRKSKYESRLELTSQSLMSFPMDIIKIILGYDYSNSFDELCQNIIDQLSNFISFEMNNIILNFDDKSFARDLGHFLKRASITKVALEKFNDFDSSPFNNLSRLLFKWFINMGRIFKKNNRETFLIWMEIYANYMLLEEFIDLPLIYEFFNSNSNVDDYHHSRTLGFLYSEIFDRDGWDSDDDGISIFTLYSKIIQEFYHETGSCKGILEKYFDGHLNGDSILRFIIHKYDSKGELKKCFADGNYRININSFKVVNFNLDKIVKLEISKDFCRNDYSDLNDHIMSFYRRNNLCFQVYKPYQLYPLLTSLKRANLLHIDWIQKFIAFPPDNLWNLQKFKQYLSDGEKWFPDIKLDLKSLFD